MDKMFYFMIQPKQGFGFDFTEKSLLEIPLTCNIACSKKCNIYFIDKKNLELLEKGEEFNYNYSQKDTFFSSISVTKRNSKRESFYFYAFNSDEKSTLDITITLEHFSEPIVKNSTISKNLLVLIIISTIGFGSFVIYLIFLVFLK